MPDARMCALFVWEPVVELVSYLKRFEYHCLFCVFNNFVHPQVLSLVRLLSPPVVWTVLSMTFSSW